ncbi:hypothetical protein ABI_11640 [Asticcacaulis biprosthecium C19]|uniref:Uncharacterized protein n=1 Tax=Asticcacaulis biprosthecium C19 TaxID=715226 RepID=F4QHJ0_9CAUL|nr:DUF692 domain-containing protein [Asticcacaulis biprosthecium]EGF92727.1 hypothetical protein ABI_11640 [Asticcacaulis biprosthecium C19]
MPPLPLAAGIGLRAPHVAQIAEHRPAVGFLEVHTENYFGGGARLKTLERLRETYPLSFHGVGLSLGRADGLDREHLRQVAALVKRFDPILVSEHLSWSAYSHVCVPDLLPVPLTHEALDIFAGHIDEFQQLVGRQVLIENPSNYVAFDGLDYDEPEFLSLLARRTGCGLLLDLNNIFVSAHNLKRDPLAYLDGIGYAKSVQQFHLAGHIRSGELLLDTHGTTVGADVWSLYNQALEKFGPKPTLIEWDSDIPPLDILLAQAAEADRHTRIPAHV